MSKVKSAIGTVNVERKKRYVRRPFLRAEVRMTFIREEDGAMFETTTSDYHVSSRNDMTLEWLRGKVAKVVADRAEKLAGMKLRSVHVEAIESIWATPYEDLYPEKTDDVKKYGAAGINYRPGTED